MRYQLPLITAPPARPRVIWKRPCGKCPSAHYPPDPEAIDMAAWYRAGKIEAQEAVFPCAWRPKKICKGVADFCGVTEKDL